MGDPARFWRFADYVKSNFDPTSKVADVASGKGKLRANLILRGFTDVTSWDLRRRYGRGYRHQLFLHTEQEHYDLVVAMHPDGATDETILYAAAHGVPFVVCPCCIVPSAAVYGGGRSFFDWKRHLVKLAERTHKVTDLRLDFEGRNHVLHGVPK